MKRIRSFLLGRIVAHPDRDDVTPSPPEYNHAQAEETRRVVDEAKSRIVEAAHLRGVRSQLNNQLADSLRQARMAIPKVGFLEEPFDELIP